MSALASAIARLVRLLALVLGTWQPPPWLRAIGRRAKPALSPVLAYARGRPWSALATVVFLVIAAVFGRATYLVQKRHSSPEWSGIQASQLSPMVLGDNQKPVPLSLTFANFGRRSSVAKLELVGKTVTSGIEISPHFEGTWTWVSDSELTFAPIADWPVGTTLTIKLAPEIFGPQVRLKTQVVTVPTPVFTSRIDSAEFYQDPRDPKIKRIVATLSFSHPVDTGDLPGRVKLFYARAAQGFGRGKDIPFAIHFDRWKGQAFVQSDPLPIPEEDTAVELVLERGARAQQGGPPSKAEASRGVQVPGLSNFFRIEGTSLNVADGPQSEAQQILTVTATTEVLESVMHGAVTAVLLPKSTAKDPSADPDERQWPNAENVSDAIADKAPKVELTPVPAEQESSRVFHFRFRAPVGRWLLIRVKSGIQSFGGYPLVHGFAQTQQVPAFPPLLQIQGNGAVLSLAGEKKVSLVARQLDAIHVDLMRVLPGEVNHLVSQTEGSFEKPAFQGYAFAPEDIAERFSEILPLTEPAPGANQYASFDFSKYVGGGAPRRGLFFLRATAWDPVKEHDLETEDDRFVLVTDLGLLAKKNADGSRELYAMHLASGLPAAGVKVQVLGRNGVAVAEAATDAEGRAHFGDLSKLERERQPVVYLASQGDDLSFLPVERSDRRLNFSRFDVGGVRESSLPGVLHAYLFSERGLYRPGDPVHVAAIVKQSDWNKSLAGVPLRWVVEDPRASALLEKRTKLSPAGFEELTFSTTETSPTGNYSVSLYTLRSDQQPGERGELLGQVSVRVEEFLPDRLRISSHFVPEPSGQALEGWVKPEGLSAEVNVQNLFGTPAENRRATARIDLSPQPPAFRRYADFTFFDPSFDPKHPMPGASDELPEGRTDKDGRVVFELPLAKYDKATYRLGFSADAFEAEGGRAVTTESSVLVSPYDYLVGVKPDGDLSFVNRSARRTVQLLAVDPQLNPKAVEDLQAVLLDERYVSVLTEQSNGTFRYVSTLKEVTVRQRQLALAAKPTPFELDTKDPGNFVLSLREASGREVGRVAYSVAGQANLSRSLDRNAELQIKLDRKDYAAGDTLKVSITAPYTGAGLITVERDHVYAARWFHTGYTSSVQEIAVPRDLEGNGYVNVSFVRALDSHEVFMSPLSTGVAPFSVSRGARTDTVTLTAPPLVKPGQELAVDYQVNHPGRIVVFGVDEGILQVARYKTPDPLGYFFRKRALQVETSQILDQLLPEFSILMRSAAGGDEAAAALGKNLNPFKRKRDKPVVFWSGILDVGAGGGTYKTTIPDSFNGQVRVMAVAVSGGTASGAGTVGAQSTSVTVRGPFVLSPNVPTFVAPGDEFQVSVGVANNIPGSGANAPVTLTLELEGGLELVDGAERKLTIGEGRETSATFKLRATDKLGSAGLTFTAQDGGVRTRIRTDLSVRPAIPFLVTARGGMLKGGQAELPHDRRMYPEQRKLVVRASRLPLGLIGGLAEYLRSYPYGCTEQIVSQAFPALVMQDRPEFGYSAEAVESSLERAYQVLGERQNGDGAFGMWAANAFVSNFQTAYAADFLTEAKERGQGAPREVLARSLNYLVTLGDQPVKTVADARDHAYALYVLARNGQPVGGAAAALQKSLEALAPQAWKTDLATAYLAAVYRILKQDDLATSLASHLELGQGIPYAFDRQDHILDSLARDGQLLFLLSRYFPERIKDIRPERLQALADSLNRGFNSFSAASVMLGFDGLARQMLGDLGANNAPPQIAEILKAGPQALTLSKGLFPEASFDEDARAVRFEDRSGLGLFFGMTEAGFDLRPPEKAVTSGLETQRELRIAGKPVTSAKLGQVVEVHLKARSLGSVLYNVAFVDLLPAGFEVVIDRPAAQASPPPAANDEGQPAEEGEGAPGEDEAGDSEEGGGGPQGSPSGMASYIIKGGTFEVNSADVREDRVVFFATVPPEARELVYQIRATNQGKVRVPPLVAHSMYEPGVEARSLGAEFEVTAP